MGDLDLIFRICGQLHAGLAVKVWVDSLKGLQSYGF